MGFKQDLFTQFARIGQALSSGKRLELVEFLAQGERSVDALAKAAGLSMANASHHLQQLRRSGLVASRKEGLNVYYQLSGDDVVELLAALRRVGERHLAEVDRLVNAFLTVKDGLEPISRQELLDRARRGAVTVLDVRPRRNMPRATCPGRSTSRSPRSRNISTSSTPSRRSSPTAAARTAYSPSTPRPGCGIGA